MTTNETLRANELNRLTGLLTWVRQHDGDVDREVFRHEADLLVSQMYVARGMRVPKVVRGHGLPTIDAAYALLAEPLPPAWIMLSTRLLGFRLYMANR